MGMGIHGEQGAKKTKWVESNELVTQCLDNIMESEEIKSGKIVVMVNNLGSVTNLEMTSVVNDVMNYFHKKEEIHVVRLISGMVMTSLDMNGVSLTVLCLPEDKAEELLA
mmetsp:Transcript_45768/g.38553  ORF Transcript_45768/g.38553 Transcript_45768/m.38553 type:complete len:110 (+) Transcript_45768:707-1036(+)